jgi:hypothetical protein
MAEGDNEIKSTRVILCEGAGDAAFLKHLINSRGLPGFYITYPAHTQPHEQGGRDGFKSRLKALKLARGFKDVTDIVVISDNDSSPAASFSRVQELIEEAGDFAIPDAPRQVAGTDPRVYVFMLPTENVAGQLETLCLRSCTDRWPVVAACVAGYEQCNADYFRRWTNNGHIEKMRLRVFLASLCDENPNTSLVHAWSRHVEMIPLNHDCFNDIANFLSSIETNGNLPLTE